MSPEDLKRAKKVHNGRYTYPNEKTSRPSRVTAVCAMHGTFKLKVHLHLAGVGCPKCKKSHSTARKTTEQFVQDAKSIHGNIYDYSKVAYVKGTIPVVLTCARHGQFDILPKMHLRGHGCPKCGNEARGQKRSLFASDTAEEFIAKAISIHGSTYDYSKLDYVDSKTRVLIICPEHGEFRQRTKNHLAGSGCPKCRARGYSAIAIEWIERTAKAMRLKNVQHALTSGEYRIPGTDYKVDGYHARSKTIFEFHGDCFHGNPSVYKANSRPNPYSDMTAKQLYRRTLAREAHLRELGYTVITIWESEYRRFRKG